MDEKITLDVHMNRNDKSFEVNMTTEIDGNKSTQKIGGVNSTACLKKVVMLLNAAFEDLEGEDDWDEMEDDYEDEDC